MRTLLCSTTGASSPSLGTDRRVFLQGLVSNDVEKVGPTQARYGALLTAQGKYLHDFMMIEFDGALWLEAEAGR